MRRMLLALVLVLPLGGCGWLGRSDETSKPEGFLLYGYVSVAGASSGPVGTPCVAPGSAVDVASGAPVRAATADGKVVAVTALASGVLASTADGYRCNFAFEFRGLPGSRTTYQIMVADRPPVAFETRGLREGRPAVVLVDGFRASTSPS